MRVDTHSGYVADERPVRFWLDGRRVEVVEIVDRHHRPGHRCFRVRGDDARSYVLCQSTESNEWEVVGVGER